MAINTTTEIFTPRGNGIGVRLVGIYRVFRHWPVIPVFLLGLVLFAGIAAPLISPHDPNKQSLPERRLPPFWYEARTENVTRTVVQRVLPGQDARISLADAQAINPDIRIGDSIEAFDVTRAGGSNKFLLGTDQLGRDILSRIIYGARISLLAAVVTLGIGGSFGVLLGLVAGWYGGVVDETIMRFVDILLAIPPGLDRPGNGGHPGNFVRYYCRSADHIHLAALRPPVAGRGVATEKHGLRGVGQGGRGLHPADFVCPHISWDD